MHYHSPKKKLLFWFFIVAIFIFLWLLWLGVDVYILTKNPLSHIDGSRAIMMATLAVILIVLLVAGLVISTMLGNKRYSRYFSVFIGVLFISLLMVRTIFG